MARSHMPAARVRRPTESDPTQRGWGNEARVPGRAYTRKCLWRHRLWLARVTPAPVGACRKGCRRTCIRGGWHLFLPDWRVLSVGHLRSQLCKERRKPCFVDDLGRIYIAMVGDVSRTSRLDDSSFTIAVAVFTTMRRVIFTITNPLDVVALAVRRNQRAEYV
jgi:hypothetical protein